MKFFIVTGEAPYGEQYQGDGENLLAAGWDRDYVINPHNWAGRKYWREDGVPSDIELETYDSDREDRKEFQYYAVYSKENLARNDKMHEELPENLVYKEYRTCNVEFFIGEYGFIPGSKGEIDAPA